MKLVIIDTGCANLSSVKYAVERLNYQPEISDDLQKIRRADKLLLPGVGTASAGMEQLKKRNLDSFIQSCTQPLLGICLGMQMLAQCSEENATQTQMLGIIKQTVQKIPAPELPIPHSGWNRVFANGHPLFDGIDEGSYFYFVHSYILPEIPETIARTNYGVTFSAAVQQNNFFGVQFHPERSGAAGAKLLKNFLEI